MRKILALVIALLCPVAALAQTTATARMLSGVNNQTGTVYIVQPLDATKITTFANVNPVAVSLSAGTVSGFGVGTIFSLQNQGPGVVTVTCVACSITAPDGSTSSAFSINAQNGADLYSAGGNYVAVRYGGGGFACGTTANPGIPFWNGTACLVDTNATLDGNGNFGAVTGTFSGAVTAASFGTTGAGGLLDLQMQTPPLSVPVNHAYIYANSITGLLDCLKNGLVECFAGLQLLGTGSTAMTTGSITTGACGSVTTVAVTGVTTGSKIIVSPASDPTGVTGYAPSASGSLYIQAFPTANNINFKVCNNTSGTLTPGALTLNWGVF